MSSFLVFALLLLAASPADDSSTTKQDFKDAGHSIKHAWKDGWHAAKKAAKSVGKSAADVTEKGAHQVKKKLDH